MLFTIGSRVRLKNTGDTGKVAAVKDDLVYVDLDDGLGRIPVPPEILSPVDGPIMSESGKGARFIPGKPRQNEEIEPDHIRLDYTVIKPWGVQLGFDPVYRTSGDPERYRVYLINDTGRELIFMARLLIGGKREEWKRLGSIGGDDFKELGDLRHQELNDNAAVELEVRPKLEQGTGPRHHHLLKIKPKKFFGRYLTAPYLNRKVYHYIIFPQIDDNPSERRIKKESLIELTRRAGKHRPPAGNLGRIDLVPDPGRLAAFPREIDLHLDKLVADPAAVPRNKILSLQISRCRQYLAEAVRLGVDRVFIIHGHGEGKLKAAVQKELAGNAHVRESKNEYHPRFGTGATEVIIGT